MSTKEEEYAKHSALFQKLLQHEMDIDAVIENDFDFGDWEVSEEGDITHTKHGYHIENDRLNENWIFHLNEKGWAHDSIGKFLNALAYAMKIKRIDVVTFSPTYSNE